MLSDRILAAVVALLALLYLWGATRIPQVAIGDPLGPSAFPILLGILLFIGAVMLVWEARRKSDGKSRPRLSRAALTSTVGIIVWMALYLLVYEALGYVIATGVFLLGLTAWFNRGRWIQNIAVSVGFSICAYLVFNDLLHGHLP